MEIKGLKINRDSIIGNEDTKWNALIEAAMAGNVVPVIGPDIICDYGGRYNANEFLVTTIAQQFGLSSDIRTFSELAYCNEFLAKMEEPGNVVTRDVIYDLINGIFSNESNIEQCFQPSAMLTKLLSIKQFPFIITTSFTPVVEREMRRLWGSREVSVLTFSNNVIKDTKPGVGDIRNAADMTRPSVYYMFGRTPDQPHRYVLTDNDMLDFCKAWLSEQTRPNNLCNCLKDKYLLTLGCGYGDWLFRFIWYCMSKSADTSTKGLMAKDERTEKSLVDYLNRINAFLPSNRRPEEIIDEIARRLENYNQSHLNEWFVRPPRSTDVFISYSRSDSAFAESLYNYLRNQGLSVWYDRNDLLGGARFIDEIDNAIAHTKVFIPIFTQSIAREAMDAHVYRREWKKAIEMQENMGSRNFIIPVHAADFDFYDADIPGTLKSHNSIEVIPGGDYSAVLASVNQALNALDTFRQYSL